MKSNTTAVEEATETSYDKLLLAKSTLESKFLEKQEKKRKDIEQTNHNQPKEEPVRFTQSL